MDTATPQSRFLAAWHKDASLTVENLRRVDNCVESRSLERHPWKWPALVLVFVLQGSFFSYIALHRFVDGDEGFYLVASRLVLLHRKPYLDFFYTQAPLLPYVYAIWLKVTGVSWVSAKVFSAILTSMLGTMVCEEIWHQTKSRIAAISGLILFCTSSLIFGFFPVVKTFSLAGLFLFSAYMLITRASTKGPWWVLVAAGTSLGFGVSTRSYLALVFPVYLWWLARRWETSRVKAMSELTAGFLLGIIPCFWLFLLSPAAFLFNNLGYHAVRSEWGLVGMWEQKFAAILQALLGSGESNGLQTSLALLVAVGLISSVGRRPYPPRFALQIAIAVAVISLLPTPVHPQYFCLCVPFLLVAAICALALVVEELEGKALRVGAAVGCGLLALAYVAASINDFRRYLVTGDDVAGVEPGLAADLRLEHVLAVSRSIDHVTQPGEPVASFWPGFVFQTTAVPYPGFENDFGMPISDQLTPAQRARFHILSPGEVAADFAAHQPPVVVLRDHVSVPTPVKYREKVRLMEDGFRNSLESDNYKRAATVGDVTVYVNTSNRLK